MKIWRDDRGRHALGAVRMQADDTGIISEYAAPVGSGPVAVTESVEVEETRDSAAEETREARRVVWLGREE